MYAHSSFLHASFRVYCIFLSLQVSKALLLRYHPLITQLTDKVSSRERLGFSQRPTTLTSSLNMSCRCLLYSYCNFWGTPFLALQWAMALPCSWLILLMYWARAVMLRCVSCSASVSSQIVCHSWCKVSTHPLLVRNLMFH